MKRNWVFSALLLFFGVLPGMSASAAVVGSVSIYEQVGLPLTSEEGTFNSQHILFGVSNDTNEAISSFAVGNNTALGIPPANNIWNAAVIVRGADGTWQLGNPADLTSGQGVGDLSSLNIWLTSDDLLGYSKAFFFKNTSNSGDIPADSTMGLGAFSGLASEMQSSFVALLESGIYSGSTTHNAVPVPPAALLFVSGLAGLLGWRHRTAFRSLQKTV